MCQGGLDPKYALRELEQGFRAAQAGIEQTDETREPARGVLALARALMARFHRKETSHG